MSLRCMLLITDIFVVCFTQRLLYLLGEVVGSRNNRRQVHQAKTHAGDDTGNSVSKIYTIFKKPVSDHDMRQCLSKTAKNKTTG